MHATKNLLALLISTILILNAACASSPAEKELAAARLSTASEPPFALGATKDAQPVLLQSADYTGAMLLSKRGSSQPLRVLTINLEHNRKQAHLSEIAQRLCGAMREMPEFILCQEVMFNRSKRAGEDNSAALLAAKLGYHSRGTQRSSDNEGVAILSRYPFEFYAARELDSQTSRLLLGFNRVSVMGEFQVPSVGRVRVVNVHFTNWGFETRVRNNQLRETLEWTAQRDLDVPADITILGGDFNMTPDSEERLLVRNREFTGDLDFEDFNSDLPTRGMPSRPSVRVDYVFIAAPTHDLRFLGERRLFVADSSLFRSGDDQRVWLSDHVPVLHEYALRTTALVAAPQTPAVAATPVSALLR